MIQSIVKGLYSPLLAQLSMPPPPPPREGVSFALFCLLGRRHQHDWAVATPAPASGMRPWFATAALREGYI